MMLVREAADRLSGRVSDTLVTQKMVTKRPPKYGRPTIRKDGIPLTPAEKQARYRARLRRARRKSHRTRVNGWHEWCIPRRYTSRPRAQCLAPSISIRRVARSRRRWFRLA